MPVYRLGSVSVAFSADTQEYVGDVRKARRAMEFLRQESKRTGKSVGRLARELGITSRQFQSLARAEKVAIGRSRALARQMRLLERRVRRLNSTHLSFRNILFSLAGSAGLGLAIRNLTQYSAQVSETADSLGLLPSELDRTRRVFGSFGLDILQTDRLLANIIAKTGEARRGSQRLAESFRTLGGSLDISNPLEQLERIAQFYSALPSGDRLEALRLVAGERFAIPVGGLLATPGQFEAELARVAEKFEDFSDLAVRINKNLDQTFIDLFGVLRIHFQNVVAENADAFSALVQAIENAIPAIANFTGILVSGALSNRGLLSAGVGSSLLIGSSFALQGRGTLGALTTFLTKTPTGRIIAALSAIGVAFGIVSDRSREAERAIANFNRVSSVLADVGRGFVNQISAPADEQLILEQVEQAEASLNKAQRRLDRTRRTIRGYYLGSEGTPHEIGLFGALGGLIGRALGIDASKDRTEREAEVDRYLLLLQELEIGLANFHDELNRVVEVQGRPVSRNQIAILRTEADTLNEIILEWQTYREEIQKATNNRDLAQLNLQLEQLRSFTGQSSVDTGAIVSAQLSLEIEQLRKATLETQTRLQYDEKLNSLVSERLRNEIAGQTEANRLHGIRLGFTEDLYELSSLSFDAEINALEESNILLEAKLQQLEKYKVLVNETLRDEINRQKDSNQIVRERLANPRTNELIGEEFQGEILALKEGNNALEQRILLISIYDSIITETLRKEILLLEESGLLQGRRLEHISDLNTLTELTFDDQLDKLLLTNQALSYRINLTQRLQELTVRTLQNEITALREQVRLQIFRNRQETDYFIIAGLSHEKDVESLKESVLLLERRLNLIRTQGAEYIDLLERQRRAQKEIDRLIGSESGALFFKAFDRALAGISNALADLAINLATGTNAFESFVRALQNISKELLRLFANAGLANLARDLNLPGSYYNPPSTNIPQANIGPNIKVGSDIGGGLGVRVAPSINNNYNIQAGIDRNTLQATLENFAENMKLQILDDIRSDPEVQDSLRSV